MKPVFAFLFLCLITLSCSTKEKLNKLEIGSYKASLLIQDNKEIPFTFDVLNDQKLNIYNADEVISVHEISYENDSVNIQLPYFEGFIKAKINDNEINGRFTKPSLNRTVPFKAISNAPRFKNEGKANHNITGNWETVFSPDSEEDKYIAKGIFKQKGNKVIGTFRTTTGDYRYLEGVLNGDSLKLSTFDGAHAFLFTAKVSDSLINGNFYSGNHWKEPFTAKLNNDYELPGAETLTQLKDGFDSVKFSFPNENGQNISLSDTRFKNKVTIVQIMGTWCPNCLDESKYYADYYNKNKSKDIEFVALAFEVATDKSNK